MNRKDVIKSIIMALCYGVLMLAIGCGLIGIGVYYQRGQSDYCGPNAQCVEKFDLIIDGEIVEGTDLSGETDWSALEDLIKTGEK